MAGKGGGAWKVAYADFVTAMMAFFMVMWLCSQNQKTRQAIARYFNNPMGFDNFGTSKKPDNSGSIFDKENTGDVPGSEGVSMGQGRDSHTPGGEVGRATKMVSDYIMEDKKAYEYWSNQAQQLKESAAAKGLDPNPKKKGRDNSDNWAVEKLSRQLREEIVQGIPKEAKGLYQDLLFRAISEVNWRELAEDLLAER
jgi:chemotaxis protein MotB